MYYLPSIIYKSKYGGWLKRLKVIVDDSGFEKVDDNKHVMYEHLLNEYEIIEKYLRINNGIKTTII